MTFIPTSTFARVLKDITTKLTEAGTGLTDAQRAQVVIERSITNGLRTKGEICAMGKAFDLNTRQVGAIIDHHAGPPSGKHLWYLDRERRYRLHAD
jgi:hypothetical protein